MNDNMKTEKTKLKFRWRWLAALLPLFALGCAVPASSPQGSLKALKELVVLKEEVKRLRNQVEEMQYDAETTLRRERNLFDDLDRRLLALERAQRLADPAQPIEGAPEVADAPANGDLGGDGAADTAATTALAPADADATELQPDGSLPEPETDAALQTSLEEQKVYDEAFALLKQSLFGEAIEKFQELIDTWPGGQLADDAYFMQAKAHLFSRKNRDALAAFENVVARYPSSDRTPEALLGMGNIHFNIGAYSRAAKIYREVLRRFPVHKVAPEATRHLRRITQNIEQTVQ